VIVINLNHLPFCRVTVLRPHSSGSREKCPSYTPQPSHLSGPLLNDCRYTNFSTSTKLVCISQAKQGGWLATPSIPPVSVLVAISVCLPVVCQKQVYRKRKGSSFFLLIIMACYLKFSGLSNVKNIEK